MEIISLPSRTATRAALIGAGCLAILSIKEDVTVDESRNNMTGTFSIVQYSTDEKTILQQVKGVVSPYD